MKKIFQVLLCGTLISVTQSIAEENTNTTSNEGAVTSEKYEHQESSVFVSTPGEKKSAYSRSDYQSKKIGDKEEVKKETDSWAGIDWTGTKDGSHAIDYKELEITIKECKKITNLILSKNKNVDDSILKILSDKKILENLEELHLESTNLSDKTSSYFADIIATNKTGILKKVFLANAGITTNGITKIAEALQKTATSNIEFAEFDSASTNLEMQKTIQEITQKIHFK